MIESIIVYDTWQVFRSPPANAENFKQVVQAPVISSLSARGGPCGGELARSGAAIRKARGREAPRAQRQTVLIISHRRERAEHGNFRTDR